jgi:hypothetical protein
MYIQVTETMFKDEFKAIRPDNFTNEGLSALYDWFIEYEDSVGEPMELDVIAICCEFSEEPLQDILDNYNLESLEELQDNTLVIAELDNGNVVYQVF